MRLDLPVNSSDRSGGAPAAGYRRAGPARPPAGFPPATAAVADRPTTVIAGALLGLVLLAVFGAVKGDVVAGLVGGLVFAAVLALAALRTRLSVGPGWLVYTQLLGTRRVALDRLHEVSNRRAPNGPKTTLRDDQGHGFEISTDLLLADPGVRDELHRALTSGRHEGRPRGAAADELLERTTPGTPGPRG